MRTLQDYLDRPGDSFDKLSPLASAIQTRIDEAGLNAWDSPDSDLDAVSTWEERALVRLVSFYCVCSNSGRIHPHLDYGLALIPELEAVDARSTVKALRELDQLRDSGFELTDSDQVDKIEEQVPGDFIWADPILDYVNRHADRYLTSNAPLQE